MERPYGKPFLGSFLNKLRDQYGILTFGGGSHFLIAPPLIITKEEIDEIFARLDQAIDEVDEYVKSVQA